MTWYDDYVGCPVCGSMQMYRDLRDALNSCHSCGFTHWATKETTEAAVERHKQLGLEDEDKGLST